MIAQGKLIGQFRSCPRAAVSGLEREIRDDGWTDGREYGALYPHEGLEVHPATESVAHRSGVDPDARSCGQQNRRNAPRLSGHTQQGQIVGKGQFVSVQGRNTRRHLGPISPKKGKFRPYLAGPACPQENAFGQAFVKEEPEYGYPKHERHDQSFGIVPTAAFCFTGQDRLLLVFSRKPISSGKRNPPGAPWPRSPLEKTERPPEKECQERSIKGRFAG